MPERLARTNLEDRKPAGLYRTSTASVLDVPVKLAAAFLALIVATFTIFGAAIFIPYLLSTEHD